MTQKRHVLIDALGIGIVAVIILIACHSIVGRKHLRAIVDNDAVGYTTAARSLAETGKLTSHIIYPSTLLQKTTKSSLYMPGYYFSLAGAYKLFHALHWPRDPDMRDLPAMQSLLVSAAAYIAAAICTFLIGLKFFDRRTGLVAAAFFLIYPANLYFSVTAMTEMPLMAAAALAFCIFVYLPRRATPWVGPILLLIPFLFRETGAFLAVPMGIVLLLPQLPDAAGGKANLGRAALFMGLSIMLLGAIYASPVSSGRPSLIKLDIFINESGAEHIYRDALSSEELKPTIGDWVRTLSRRFVSNARTLIWRINHQQREFVILLLLPLVAAIPLGFIWGGLKRDVPALGAAALLLLTLCFVCMFYSVRHDRPVRVAMFAFPLVALLGARLAMALVTVSGPRVPEQFRNWLLVFGVVGLAAWVFSASAKGFNDMMAWDLADERGNRLVEALKIKELDKGGTLVAPHLLGVPFLNQHPNVVYSFVPANLATLKLLCEKYPVNTLIFNPDDALDLTQADIRSRGLYLQRRMQMEGVHYLVFRRPAFPGEEMLWKDLGEEHFTWNPRQRVRY